MNVSVLFGQSQHYYPSLCGLCHQPGTVSSPLKRCSGCKSFYYCSRDHQRLDRERHRPLCHFLADTDYFRDKSLANVPAKSRAEWVKSIAGDYQLYQLLEDDAEQFFLFPPVCRQTGCFSPTGEGDQGQLLTCPHCLSVSWCSRDHQAQGAQHHQQFCYQLKLARILDSLENQHGIHILVPDLPSHLDTEYHEPPATAEDQFRQLSSVVTGSGDYQVEDDLDLVVELMFLSDLLSGPLTLLECGHKFLPGLASMEALKIHIVGSHYYESICSIKWEYLAHRLPALKSLEMMFVGPSLSNDNNNSKQEKVETCGECSELGRVVTHGSYSMTYQQYRLQDDSPPDLVLVQNCGFHEHPLDSDQWVEGWAGLGSLLHQTGTPVIFTSYTKAEALADLKRFKEHCGQEVEVLTESEENKMRSYRPRRDMGLEEEIDIFYNNFYINVVRAK